MRIESHINYDILFNIDTLTIEVNHDRTFNHRSE